MGGATDAPRERQAPGRWLIFGRYDDASARLAVGGYAEAIALLALPVWASGSYIVGPEGLCRRWFWSGNIFQQGDSRLPTVPPP